MRSLPLFAALMGMIVTPLTAAYSHAAVVKAVTPTAAIGEISGAPLRYTFPLSKFVATPGPLRLQDSAIATKIAVPFSARLKPKTVTLTLNFTNSIALDPATSVMSVRLNETTLAQIRLDPKSPVGSAVINLPAELVRPGYNTIALGLSQHNGSDCEDPEAPELWTEVNTAESSLTIDGEVSAAPMHLADMSEIFSPGIGGARRVALVTPPLNKDATMIEAGALVAQAIALHTQYESAALSHAVLPAQPGTNEPWMLDDQVIIGTKDQLAGLLAAGEVEAIKGPFLGLRSLDRRQIRIVVSGNSPQDVIAAAQALTKMDLPLTDAASAAIRAVKAPANSAGRTLQPARIYSFDELGLGTNTVSGLGIQKLALNLPMPPDLYAPEQAALKLVLDLNYGAGFGMGSVINVDVNGKFLHGINLGNAEGAAYRGYTIPIPLRDLVGGTNQIGFSVFMRSIRKDKCSGVSGRHLALTLFGTSSIELPEAARVAAQPDLDLMVRTGFPYAQAGATPGAMWVSDETLVAAGWTLLGRLAQVSGAALPHMTFSIGGEPPRGPAILIGEAKALPPRIFQGAMQAFGEVNRVPYTSFTALQGANAPGLWDQLLGLQPSQLPKTALPAGTIEQSNDLGDNVILTAVRSEGSATGTTTVVTAAHREQLAPGVAQLISPQYWGQARGDFMMWRASSENVTTLRLSPQFQTADTPQAMTLRFYVSQHPWWWLGGTLLVLMALSGLTVWMLARRRGDR